jgi:3-hydroxybutyryl-CoA dehydrogenase
MIAGAHSIGIVGAGQMGREIALIFALADYPTWNVDPDQAALTSADLHVGALLGGTPYLDTDRARVHARLTYTERLADLSGATVVIEAIPEDEALKRKVLAEIAATTNPGTLIASNTSSLPISLLAEALPADRQDWFIGMHFAAPVSRMKFLEIIPGNATADAAIEMATEFAAVLGKQPTFSKDVAGFASNRLLFALLTEAQRLVDEGVATVEDIDRTCRLALGHPVGPFELMDHVSNDLALSIHEILEQAYGDRFAPSKALQELIGHGALGRKAGRGWHNY